MIILRDGQSDDGDLAVDGDASLESDDGNDDDEVGGDNIIPSSIRCAVESDNTVDAVDLFRRTSCLASGMLFFDDDMIIIYVISRMVANPLLLFMRSIIPMRPLLSLIFVDVGQRGIKK